MENDDKGFKLLIGVVVTAILIGFALFNIYYNVSVSKVPQTISILLSIVPAAFAIYKLLKLYSDKTGDYTFLSAGLIILSIVFILTSIVSLKAFNRFTKVDNYKSYEKVLKYDNYPNNKMISHFPDKIPDNPENVEFYESGKIGSDDYELRLSYKISKDDVSNEVFEKIVNSAKFKTISKEGILEVKDKLYVPDIVYDKLKLQENSHCNNFAYYILDASDINEGSKNTNYSKGIIVDYDNMIITYYAISCK